MHPQRILVQSSGAALLLWVYVFSLNAQTPDTECFAGPKDRLVVIQAQDRQLDFPSDFDNATISLFDQPKPSETMTGFFSFPSLGREIGAASGQVTVPANAFVSITVVASDRYLDFIESLPDRGIDRLELRGATISTRLLRLLESKQSFRQLEFVDCKLTEVDGSSLNGAPQLQQVYIESSESIDINRTLLPWLAKCPSLQTMSNGLVLNSDDLKSIKNHRAPLFIKVELRNTVAETVQLLNEIPGLVGVEFVVAGDVTSPDLEHLSQLKTIELIVLNGGSLDSSLLRAISRIPKLRTIRTHPGTRISVPMWGDQPVPKSTVTGTLILHKAFGSTNLKKPRTIAIWLPPNYTDSTERYPVLYLHDGQNLFDASTAAFGTEWNADETARERIAQNRIKPLILVGIWNTSDRIMEYTPTFDKSIGAGGRGKDYVLFLVEELWMCSDLSYSWMG